MQDATKSDQEVTQVDWQYWARMTGWSPEEAAALLLRIDPNNLSEVNAAGSGRPTPHDKLKRWLHRAEETDDLEPLSSPREVLEWAKSNGIDIPKELEQAVASSEPLKNWRAIARRRWKRVKELEGKLEKIDDEHLSGNLRVSLLKIIFVLATKHYGLGRKGPSKAAADIELAMADEQVQLTKQTIETHLNTASELFQDRDRD